MASNRKAFDRALKRAANHASNGSWAEAIRAYTRALKEFPEDTTALVGLGEAYLESDQLEPAREISQELQLIARGDPGALSYLATLEERLGDVDRASAFCMDLATVCEEQGDLDRAIEAWARATQLAPALSEAYHRLVQAHTDLGQPAEAVAVCLAAAQELHAQGQTAEMGRILRMALQLDPRNEEATRLLELALVGSGVEQESEAEGVGTIESARKAAWRELAQMLFEDLSLEVMSDTDVVPIEERFPPQDLPDVPVERSQVVALIGRAVDLDSNGHGAGAIQAYREVIGSGVDRVAVHLCLGLLYKSQNQLEEACRHLSIAKFHPDYALASHLALGECYQLHDRFDLAMQHYVRALKFADLRVVDETRVSDIVAIYDSMIDGYDRGGHRGHEQSTVQFFNTLRTMFHAEDWLERVLQLRTYLDGLSPVGMTMSLADGLKARNFDRVLQELREIRSLEQQGKLLTAREQCYRALEEDPIYLPHHFRLADICIRQGLVDDAVSKYLIIAEIYEIDDDLVQTANVHRAILSVTPLDVTVRSKLIDLLMGRKEIDQAVEQYLALADAYYQQARVDKALEIFNQALQLTERSQAEEAWRLKILYFMADLYTQRVEWDEAIKIYEQIRELAPDDTQAVLYLMDLYFKLGKPDEAMQELQRLLEPYEEQNDIEAIVGVLDQAMSLRPNELPIRARLSQAYIEGGMKQKAIEELDAIGEMQLEADMRDEAIQTIRLIISMKPPNVRAYKQLLYHLLS